jgi:hypothetical protein
MANTIRAANIMAAPDIPVLFDATLGDHLLIAALEVLPSSCFAHFCALSFGSLDARYTEAMNPG